MKSSNNIENVTSIYPLRSTMQSITLVPEKHLHSAMTVLKSESDLANHFQVSYTCKSSLIYTMNLLEYDSISALSDTDFKLSVFDLVLCIPQIPASANPRFYSQPSHAS